MLDETATVTGAAKTMYFVLDPATPRYTYGVDGNIKLMHVSRLCSHYRRAHRRLDVLDRRARTLPSPRKITFVAVSTLHRFQRR